MHLNLQEQPSSTVQETLWSAAETSYLEAKEKSEVWQEDTWSFSGVIHCAEVLCEVH